MDIFSNLFAHAVALSALAVVAIQQILKLNLVPVAFANKYPVPTLILLSTGAAIVTVIATPLHPVTISDWVILAGTVAVTAALTYRTTIKNWAELRALEGPGTK